MRFFEFLRNRDVLTTIFRILQQVARTTNTVVQARKLLADRLAKGAMAGDFDDAVKRLAVSDELVKDFVENG